MKSCRNCAKSAHGWGDNPELSCRAFDKQVAPPVSMRTEDNLKADADCRTYANNCNAYTPEGDVK
jgi:hypothetical protein